MKRKECETGLSIVDCRLSIAVLIAGVTAIGTPIAGAGTVRVVPSAVVVADALRLTDVSELRGFDADTERRLRELTVGAAPSAGGSRLVRMDQVREALRDSGVNMAHVALSGATECAVTRPAAAMDPPAAKAPKTAHKGAPAVKAAVRTLKDCVEAHFRAELARYGGEPEITFDRTPPQLLELSEPTFSFHVRRGENPPIGLVSLEVEIRSGDTVTQTAPMVVQVSMRRPTVIARRAINQDAPVDSADVAVVPMSFARLDPPGFDDPTKVVGQRAKRFVPAGQVIEPNVLEPVPLVLRGQTVTLASVVGGISVVTTAKAVQNGFLGETVRIRAGDKSGAEFEGVVVGPGRVQIGVARSSTIAMADAGGEGQP
jgi:flagella basal body P-ring formation protein FlgA